MNEIKEIEKRIEMLKNCCVQIWATKKEKEHWEKGIIEYEKELIFLEEINKNKKIC